MRDDGGVAERLKAHAWKACIRETVSRVRIPLPPPASRRERLSVAILPRENAWNLRHLETDLCTLERGQLLNPFSRGPLSLELCTFTRRYGLELPFKTDTFLRSRLTSSSKPTRSTDFLRQQNRPSHGLNPTTPIATSNNAFLCSSIGVEYLQSRAKRRDRGHEQSVKFNPEQTSTSSSTPLIVTVSG
jgi:hypothetical protein